MMVRETFTRNELSIELLQSDVEVRLQWKGKSNEREPDAFLLPVMLQALERTAGGARQLVLDFSLVEYMNSSTFAPLVRVLEQARRQTAIVRLEYSRDRKWQSLSFAALKVFETTDGRISVHAK